MARVQTLLAQRYELHEVVGRGAMGVVYRGVDSVLGRDVAVKVLALERSEDPTFVARFEREALAVARLSDPRIVSVYDSGRDEATRFIVMEYVRGSSLAQIVRERGPLAPEEAAAIGAQIAGALAAAHRAGIIHRDVKPANVMVDERGSVKVLDFGIAKAAAGTALTQTATVLGSAPYLAPEVIRGKPADERSDIYSLGCVLYELLAGRPPFTGELAAAVLHQHDTVEPRPPSSRRGAIPAALDALVMEMLAKDPRSRPRSAAWLARALPTAAGAHKQPRRRAEAAVAGTGSRAGPSAEATTAAAGASAAGAAAAPTRALRRARRRFSRWETAALALALAIILAGLALAVTTGSSPRHPARASSTAARASAHPASHAHRTPPKRVASHTHTETSSAGGASAPTVAAAAGALTALVTEDSSQGTLDQQAATQILSGLRDVLSAYEKGNAKDAVHHAGDLANHVEQLAAHGDIQPAALPAITGAVSSLSSAVERAAPALESAPPGGAKGNVPPPPADKPKGHKGPHGGGGD